MGGEQKPGLPPIYLGNLRPRPPPPPVTHRLLWAGAVRAAGAEAAWPGLSASRGRNGSAGGRRGGGSPDCSPRNRALGTRAFNGLHRPRWLRAPEVACCPAGIPTVTRAAARTAAGGPGSRETPRRAASTPTPRRRQPSGSEKEAARNFLNRERECTWSGPRSSLGERSDRKPNPLNGRCNPA